MNAKIRRTLTSIAFIAGFAPLISAGTSNPSPGGSDTSTAAQCPADDQTVPHAASAPETAASSSAEEAWLAERERELSSLVEVRHPDGTVSVDLQEAFWSRIVMQRNPDGSNSIRCFPAGARVVLPLAPTPPQHEEK